jgi:hypothetical protein
MSYDQKYYDERKKELETDFNKLKDETFQDIITLTDKWRAKANDFQKKFQDITIKENESLKQEAEKKDAEVKPDTK